MSKRYAIVSIGTNSTRLLLADVEPDVPRVELVRSSGTRIGEGLGHPGALGDEPIRRTLEAVAQYQRAVRGRYIKLFAVATSALRRASNEEAFAKQVEAELGVPLRILSGEEEAAASYRGALTAFGASNGQSVGVLDVGGGSSEYAVGSALEPESVVSCEIGAVRLTESVPELAGGSGAPVEAALERARAAAREALAGLKESPRAERFALVGGSATTAAAIVRGRPISGTFRLTRAMLQDVLAQLLGMTLEERKAVPGMRPQRADILPAGIIAIDAAMEILGAEEAIATTADLLLGILLQARDASAGQRPVARAGVRARKGMRQ